MAEEGAGVGSLFSRDRLPTIALAVTGLLLLLTFAVGWHAIQMEVRHWSYDSNQPEGKGSPLPNFEFDLQMKMFNLETNVNPISLESRIEEQGAPTYDQHAGRIGTTMLGVFLLQVTGLATFGAAAAFYGLSRKKDFMHIFKRLCAIFLVLGAFTLVYFAFAIDSASQDDVDYILTQYRFDEQAAYDLSDLEVGFLATWSTNEPQQVTVQGRSEVWEVTAQSRPSAGWWLQLAAMGTMALALVLKTREPDASVVVSEAAIVRAERSDK